MNKSLVLASQSPRRKALLAQLGYQFTISVSDIDETVAPNEQPTEYVQRLALEKAQHVFSMLKESEHRIVLGADTCVVCQDKILGKPIDKEDSKMMLSLLSDSQHQVYTAIAIVGKGIQLTKIVETQVFFKALTPEEIAQYWQSGEPQDKAGSYAIQGLAGQFVKSINGSYSAVVGLPLYESAQLLSQAGLTATLPKSS